MSATGFDGKVFGNGLPLIAAWYAARVIRAMRRENSNGSGWMAFAVFDVEGHEVPKVFNVGHANPEVVSIATREMNALAYASGRVFEAPDDMVGAECRVEISTKSGTPEIVGFKTK